MVGVLGVGLTTGLAVLAFVVPYTAEVVRPLPPGQEYVGLSPTVSVDCGSVLAPREEPAYPPGTRHLTAASVATARTACHSKRPNMVAMGITSAAVGLLLLAAISYSAVPHRRAG